MVTDVLSSVMQPSMYFKNELFDANYTETGPSDINKPGKIFRILKNVKFSIKIYGLKAEVFLNKSMSYIFYFHWYKR